MHTFEDSGHTLFCFPFLIFCFCHSTWRGYQQQVTGHSISADIWRALYASRAPGPSIHPHQHLPEVPQSYGPNYKHKHCQDIRNPSLAKPQGNVSSRKSKEEGSERLGGALLQGLQELSSEHFSTSSTTEKANTTDWPQGITLKVDKLHLTPPGGGSVSLSCGSQVKGNYCTLMTPEAVSSETPEHWLTPVLLAVWQAKWLVPSYTGTGEEELRTKYKRLLLTAFTFQL